MKTTKKSLAFILALALMLTLVPASAFASTDLSVATVKTVSDDSVFQSIVYLKAGTGGLTTGGSIQLTLENADFGDSDDNITREVTEGALSILNSAVVVQVTTDEAMTNVVTPAVSEISVTDKTAEFELNSATAIPKDGMIAIALNLKSGEPGDIKLTVTDHGTGISNATITIATVSGGKTVAKVLDSTIPSVWRMGSVDGASFEIRESSVNALKVADGAQQFKLRLPADMEWVTGAGGTKITGMTSSIGAGGERDLICSITASNDSVAEVAVITPVFKVTSDAKLGDVAIQVIPMGSSKVSSASDLVVATYSENTVKVTTVKEADLPTIYAGAVEDGDKYEIEFTLEEEVNSGLRAGYPIKVTFPSFVQVASGSALNGEIKVEVNGTKSAASSKVVANLSKDTSSFEFDLPTDNGSPAIKETRKEKVKVTIPVTVDAATESQDLKVTVEGGRAGLSETEIVVAKIVAPITAEVQKTDIRAGLQKQNVGDIVIKETAAGVIQGKENGTMKYLSINIGDIKGTVKDAKVEVISGDISLGDVKTDDTHGMIAIPIKAESSKASEIKISGITFTADRTPAEGYYNVKIGGTALVENADYNDEDFSGNVINTPYINVITRADDNLYGTATFKIGEKGYSVLVNGQLEKFEMDTAAFTRDQRTMIPVKYVMLALGGTENDVVWDSASQTATFFKGDRVCVIKIGSNVMTVNGAQVVMDTAAFTKDQRTFVPIKYVATALGCTVDWDAATETVTINQ